MGDLTRRVANVFTQTCGLQQGDHLALMLPRVPEWWLVAVGCMRTGQWWKRDLVDLGAVLEPMGPEILGAVHPAWHWHSFEAFAPVSVLGPQSKASCPVGIISLIRDKTISLLCTSFLLHSLCLSHTPSQILLFSSSHSHIHTLSSAVPNFVSYTHTQTHIHFLLHSLRESYFFKDSSIVNVFPYLSTLSLYLSLPFLLNYLRITSGHCDTYEHQVNTHKHKSRHLIRSKIFHSLFCMTVTFLKNASCIVEYTSKFVFLTLSLWLYSD